MNYIHPFHKNLRLVSREEGKIKSYKSSVDLRSWSHDAERRDRYLKEWIRSDMPVCVIPVHLLAKILNTMTCRSRRKVAPKCHPDCKSKLVLESICNSCHAMQECLKKEASLDSYFEEEEFETCHWPCERCLEVLKSIKMFWKIIVEKIFNINLSKAEEFSRATIMSQPADTVHSVAKMWEQELIEQTMFVHNIMPLFKQKPKAMENRPMEIAQKGSKSGGDIITLHKSSPKSSLCSKKPSNITRVSDKTIRRKVTKCTSIKIKMVDVETNTSNTENEEAKIYKHNVEYLQKKFNRQVNEMEHLKRENNSLKLELENFYESCSCKVPLCVPAILSKRHHMDSDSDLPKPFESTDDTCNDSCTKGIDSEMIITMKNCKNENFKHISLLQVLHKTNEPLTILENISKPNNKENPIELLTKVQNTFGELVRREIDVVNKVNITSKISEITASFYRVNASKSEPSCSTLDICSKVNTCTTSSESNFVST